MNRHSFSLSSIGMTRGRAQVKLDGEDISDAVNGVGLDFSARDHPRVMLELSGVSADVAVDDVEIQLPVKVVELLGRLGWKSPEQYKAVHNVASSIVAGEALSEPARVALDRVLRDHPVINSDDATGDSAAGGVGRVIT